MRPGLSRVDPNRFDAVVRKCFARGRPVFPLVFSGPRADPENTSGNTGLPRAKHLRTTASKRFGSTRLNPGRILPFKSGGEHAHARNGCFGKEATRSELDGHL